MLQDSDIKKRESLRSGLKLTKDAVSFPLGLRRLSTEQDLMFCWGEGSRPQVILGTTDEFFGRFGLDLGLGFRD